MSDKPSGAIGFIGGGNMAEALIAGLIGKGIYAPDFIWVSDVRRQRLLELTARYQVNAGMSNGHLVEQVSTVVLSVKPQTLAAVLEEIAPSARPNSVIISIAAGKTTAFIRSFLPKNPLVRAMPNTPALIGQGMTALYAAPADKSAIPTAKILFDAVGKTVVVDDEAAMDAVTAVSGSGPAYFFLWMEHLIAAGAKLGLPETMAQELVLQTATGATQLAAKELENGKTLSELRQNVTSPGGTTAAALDVFAQRGLQEVVAQALQAAHQRSIALSR